MSQWEQIELGAESILFDDADLVAVDKPSGVLSDASRDPNRDHLGLALRRRQGDDGTDFLPVHRLDLGTSGVVLFARSKSAATALMQQFQARTVTKHYQAIVHMTHDGAWAPGDTFDRRSYLRHHKGVSQEVRSGGKPAHTDFEVVAVDQGLALVQALPKTGRTHQLRVHLGAVGSPIVGDELYGHGSHRRLWLHAKSLTVDHPSTGEPLVLRSRQVLELSDGAPLATTIDL